MDKTIVISDIHGCAETFRQLLSKTDLQRVRSLILLGDYINKGPNSRGVFDYIFELQQVLPEIVCLRGNHEQMLIDAFDNAAAFNFFIEKGGMATLTSFGVQHPTDIPAKYLEFIMGLPHLHVTTEYLFVHAGLNFEASNPFTDYHSMLNIRDYTVDLKITGNRKIIHGHVPTPFVQLSQMLLEPANKYCIDAGCVYTHLPGLNQLAALDLEHFKLIAQPNID